MQDINTQYYVAISDELDSPIEFTNLDKEVYLRKEPFPFGTRLVGAHSIDILQDIMTVPDIVVNEDVAECIIEYMQRAIFTIGYNYLQLVPTHISPNMQYYLLHVMKFIPCLVQEESAYSKQFDGISYVEKLVLDHTQLNKIPIQERLMFRLEEMPRIILFEDGMVDAIAQVKPKGCYFVPVEEWRTDYGDYDPDEGDNYEFDGT